MMLQQINSQVPKPEGLPTMVGYQAAGAAPFLRGAPVET